MIEFAFVKGDVRQSLDGDFEVILKVSKGQKLTVEKFFSVIRDNDKPMTAKIDKKRNKRSLDANAYMWLLCTKIADELRASKDEIYLKMLKRYGQSQVVSVVEEATEMFKKSVKYVEDFGEATLNGKKFKHLKVFTGSSEYDSRQMSILIDGVVSEAKDLDIDTMTPAEIEKLKNMWGKKCQTE